MSAFSHCVQLLVIITVYQFSDDGDQMTISFNENQIISTISTHFCSPIFVKINFHAQIYSYVMSQDSSGSSFKCENGFERVFG